MALRSTVVADFSRDWWDSRKPARLGLVIITLILGWLLRHLATDDPFVTYRYAANLAAGVGFVYHPGSTTLSTTTPFYGWLLGQLARCWSDIPQLSNLLSALSLLGTSLVLLQVTGIHAPLDKKTGIFSAYFFLLFPLNWLSLGFESGFYLLLVSGAFLTLSLSDTDSAPSSVSRPSPTVRHLLLCQLLPGLLLGLATLTRFDGVVPTAVWGVAYLWRTRRLPWVGAGAYLATMLPMLLWLTWLYGSPLPATLVAKKAQQTLGITGFYPGTDYLAGLVILLRAWLGQSPLHWLWMGVAGAGLVESVRRNRWVLPWAGWAGAHGVAYILLGATPYFWHYTPMTPGIALLVGVGSSTLLRWVSLTPLPISSNPDRIWSMFGGRGGPPCPPAADGHGSSPPQIEKIPVPSKLIRSKVPGTSRPSEGNQTEPANIVREVPGTLRPLPSFLHAAIYLSFLILLLVPLIWANLLIHRALTQPILPPPTAIASKVLPEAKVTVYRQVGEWLAQYTPSDALVGVTEVGVMGYYARRPMVDFLGLLDPQVAEALGRGDLGWTLRARRPDYVVLTGVNPLYSYDMQGDANFRAGYTPVQRFVDDRFWGSPVTIYQRVDGASDDQAIGHFSPESMAFGGQLLLRQVVGSDPQSPLFPGQSLTLNLDWQTLTPPVADYTLFVHLVGAFDRIVAQADLPLLNEQGAYSREWSPGALHRLPVQLLLPATAHTPDILTLRVGLYDPQTGARLSLDRGGDSLDLVPTFDLQPDPAGQIPFNFGQQLSLTDYMILGQPVAGSGATISVELSWQALTGLDADYKLFVHLVGQASGEKIAQVDARLDAGDLPTQVWDRNRLYHRRVELLMPPNPGPGIYDLWVGVYNGETGGRLSVLDGVGNPMGDHIRLGPVRIP